MPAASTHLCKTAFPFWLTRQRYGLRRRSLCRKVVRCQCCSKQSDDVYRMRCLTTARSRAPLAVGPAPRRRRSARSRHRCRIQCPVLFQPRLPRTVWRYHLGGAGGRAGAGLYFRPTHSPALKPRCLRPATPSLSGRTWPGPEMRHGWRAFRSLTGPWRWALRWILKDDQPRSLHGSMCIQPPDTRD